MHGRGLAAVSTLAGLFPEWALARPHAAAARGARGVLAWGRKPSAARAEAWAARRGLPVLRLEDGFLRSVGLGADEPPLSVVWDDLGIYYDARSPSRLEQLVRQGIHPAQAERAEALRAQWCAARVSKYNQAREAADPAWAGAVLVVDQTWGDAAIRCGQAGPDDFAAMLRAALAEHPQRRILLKVHPDVVAGRKRGHFDAVLPALPPADRARVQLLAHDLHPPALLQQVAAVYTVTSQMGFEALLWGLPVRCFGMPFYAGWGLTADAQPAPARRGAATLDALVHAALVAYPRYLHPETGQRCWPGWACSASCASALHRSCWRWAFPSGSGPSCGAFCKAARCTLRPQARPCRPAATWCCGAARRCRRAGRRPRCCAWKTASCARWAWGRPSCSR